MCFSDDQVLSVLNKGNPEVLARYDQLHSVRRLEQAFQGFDEEFPHFFPTFKLLKAGSRDSLEYPTTTVNFEHMDDPVQPITYYLERVPSYTDRVLVRSQSRVKQNVKRRHYRACYDLRSSDHAPVYATFDVKVGFNPVLLDISSTFETGVSTCFILLSSLYVKLKRDFNSEGRIVSQNTAKVTVSAPFFACAEQTEFVVPVVHWEASLEPAFKGSASITSRSSVEAFLRNQKLFLKIQNGTMKVYGCLRVDYGFLPLNAGSVPFEIELYSKQSMMQPLGMMRGNITSFTTR